MPFQNVHATIYGTATPAKSQKRKAGAAASSATPYNESKRARGAGKVPSINRLNRMLVKELTQHSINRTDPTCCGVVVLAADCSLTAWMVDSIDSTEKSANI